MSQTERILSFFSSPTLHSTRISVPLLSNHIHPPPAHHPCILDTTPASPARITNWYLRFRRLHSQAPTVPSRITNMSMTSVFGSTVREDGDPYRRDDKVDVFGPSVWVGNGRRSAWFWSFGVMEGEWARGKLYWRNGVGRVGRCLW